MPGNLVLRTRRERKNGRKHPRRTRNPPAQSRKKIVFTIENSGELAKLFHAKRTLLNVSLAAMLQRKKKKEKEKKEEAKPPPRFAVKHYQRTNDLTVTIFYLEYYFLQLWPRPKHCIYIYAFPCFLVQKSEKCKLA